MWVAGLLKAEKQGFAAEVWSRAQGASSLSWSNISLLSRWRELGSKKKRNLPKVTQEVCQGRKGQALEMVLG